MEILRYLGAVALVLGVLVFVHEFGHYAVAKLCGVRVEVFSLGFGKRLFGFKRGDTDYRVSILPLGGYVKMAGENPMEPRTGDPGEFMSHPRWQRFLIAVAGPAMNIFLAIGILAGIYTMHGYEHPVYEDQPAVVGWILDGSPAQKAGLERGDKIVRIQNINNPTWGQMSLQIALSPDQSVEVAIQRGNQILHKTFVPQPMGEDRLGEAGLAPPEPAIVGDIDPGLPAAKAGIQIN